MKKFLLLMMSILIMQFFYLTIQSKTKSKRSIHKKNNDKNINVLKNLTIEQAIKIAYQNRPSLKAYKQATEASKYTEKSVLSGYFPQLTLTHANSFSKGTKSLQNTTTLQGSQLIYSFAGPLELYKIAKKDTAYSEYAQELHKDRIRYEVETSFLQAWLLQEKKMLIKLLENSAYTTIKKSDHEKKLDLLGQNDWLKDASTYAKSTSEVYYYIDNLKNAQNTLEYFMGKAFKINFTNLIWNYKKKIKIKSLNFYFEKALKYRKELKEIEKEIEKYQEYQNYYNKTYLPSVSLSGNTSNGSGTISKSIGITFNWKILDGGANFQNQNVANANKLKSLMEKESYSQQIKYEVQKAYYELAQYLKELIAKNVELSQAKNEFNLNKLQLKIGNISQVDFDQSKYDFYKIKNDWLTLKVNAAIKKSALNFACGYPEY